jgi:predicted alpha/beta hydrolase family esterase
LADWNQAIGDAVRQTGTDVIIVAHSLGCLVAAEWITQPQSTIRGAFLVAPPDTAGPHFPVEAAASFMSVRARPLRVPGIVVTSDDDPYCGVEAAAQLAHDWEIPRISAGRGGHLNSASGVGAWTFGAALLTAFVAGTAVRTPFS